MPDPNSPDPIEPEGPSPTPFLAAVGIVLVGIAVVVLFQMFGGDETPPDQDLLVRTAHDYANAWNADDGDILERLTCDGTASEAGPLDGVARAVRVDGVDSVTISGDQATATVHSTVEGEQTTSTWEFRRQGDIWRVCSDRS